MPENCTKHARSPHRGRALFLLSFFQKVGEFMDGYDNDELLMLLDDDLFPAEDVD